METDTELLVKLIRESHYTQPQNGKHLAVRAVFLDRDGVINENRRDHVKDWTEFKFIPGALQAIARLSRAGIRVFVVTNQAIINRQVVARDIVDAINQRMVKEVERLGGRIEAVAYCPHKAEEQCGCRKPQPGLLLELARRYEVDLKEAVVVGDALTDVDAARAAGCQAILVMTGRGSEQLRMASTAGRGQFAVVQDLPAATDLVLGTLLARA